MSTTPTTATTLTMDAPPLPRRNFVQRTLLDSAYAFTAFPIALVGFVFAVVLLAVGIGLTILTVGLALLVLGALIARGFAGFERVRIRGMLGMSATNPTYLRANPTDGGVKRFLTPLRDPQSWLDWVWSIVGLITGTVAFSVTVVWWAAVLNGASYWFWEQFLPERDAGDQHLASMIGFGDSREADIGLMFIIGAFAFLTLPWVMRFAALTHSSLAKAMLCSRAELQRRAAAAEGSRDAARVAESESLRRLERDIHDGPQQRLVRLSMDLGRARTMIRDDPDRADEIVEGARRQATDTVAELRSLSRGIAPPLLVDRGLAAAVDEMAQGCPVPTTAELDIADSLPPHVETAAYFVVAETLTNVAKHSEAGEASIRATMTNMDSGMVLEVTVTDDGVGGAHEGKGLGLAGLARRVEAAEGELVVDSPDGGPTVVTARIPVLA